MKSDPGLSILTLTEAEWTFVKGMVTFLEPFSVLTDRVSKQHVPLMSLTAAIFIEMYNHLESYQEESQYDLGIIKAAKLACEKLNVYYPKTAGLVYVLGIVLDPRCKLDWHKSVGFDKLVPNYRRTILSYFKSHYMTSAENVIEEPNDDDLIQRQMKKARFDSRNEFEKYLSGNPCRLVEGENGVLSWWKEHENDYPTLSKLARDFLGVSATGVPEECMFSMGHSSYNLDESASIWRFSD
ncbi:unnamed protein product [Allacma fusca]|uniref:HAT C-terminal dimerisation domain-containing protein n=1 Tax=Allacma fusca TaxID=39272 RepID=A0A8J2LSS7_9HEXA|nr:unnamed protein product [Allacma fusca]